MPTTVRYTKHGAVVVSKSTDRLRKGDVLNVDGMRLELGAMRTYPGNYSGQYRTVYQSFGKVLNLDEIDDTFIRNCVKERDGHWVVQGNELATWYVER